MTVEVMGALDRIASRQLGLVTTAQLHELGLGNRQIDRLISTASLIRIRYLVYRLAGSPVSWEQLVLAATLGSRAPVVASHGTAATLRQLRHWDRCVQGIHITADRRVFLSGVISHVSSITPDERTCLGGIPITTAERTIIDMSSFLTARELGDCVDDALRRGLVHLERLRRLATRAADNATRRATRQRLAPLHDVLADRIAGYRPDDSEFETRMNAEWDRLHLPPGERQYRVVCGPRTYRLDRALVDTKIGVEWDSLTFHGSWSGLDHDSDRRADLTAAGWVVLGFTRKSRPERIARAVHRLWRDRGGEADQVAQSG